MHNRETASRIAPRLATWIGLALIATFAVLVSRKLWPPVVGIDRAHYWHGPIVIVLWFAVFLPPVLNGWALTRTRLDGYHKVLSAIAFAGWVVMLGWIWLVSTSQVDSVHPRPPQPQSTSTGAASNPG